MASFFFAKILRTGFVFLQGKNKLVYIPSDPVLFLEMLFIDYVRTNGAKRMCIIAASDCDITSRVRRRSSYAM